MLQDKDAPFVEGILSYYLPIDKKVKKWYTIKRFKVIQKANKYGERKGEKNG